GIVCPRPFLIHRLHASPEQLGIGKFGTVLGAQAVWVIALGTAAADGWRGLGYSLVQWITHAASPPALSVEDHRLVAVHQNAVLQVIAQASRKHHLFHVLTQSNHVFDAVAMADTHNVLLDDRPGIQLFGHIVTGRPDQLDATQRRLVVGLGAD